MNAHTKPARSKFIQDHLISNGYVWVKHPLYQEFFVRNDIAVIISYKMVQFHIYDRASKKVTEKICQFSKGLDENLWKKFSIDLIDHTIEESYEMMLDEIERTINNGKVIQR